MTSPGNLSQQDMLSESLSPRFLISSLGESPYVSFKGGLLILLISEASSCKAQLVFDQWVLLRSLSLCLSACCRGPDVAPGTCTEVASLQFISYEKS